MAKDQRPEVGKGIAEGRGNVIRQGPDPIVEKADPETQNSLQRIEQERRAQANQVNDVRTVLVVLSAAGMVFDIEALRQKIHLTYKGAAVFFISAMGKPVGATAPRKVDLLIDFTGPGQRQGLFYARK